MVTACLCKRDAMKCQNLYLLQIQIYSNHSDLHGPSFPPHCSLVFFLTRTRMAALFSMISDAISHSSEAQIDYFIAPHPVIFCLHLPALLFYSCNWSYFLRCHPVDSLIKTTLNRTRRLLRMNKSTFLNGLCLSCEVRI